jgi:hypothetical protein
MVSLVDSKLPARVLPDDGLGTPMGQRCRSMGDRRQEPGELDSSKRDAPAVRASNMYGIGKVLGNKVPVLVVWLSFLDY